VKEKIIIFTVALAITIVLENLMMVYDWERERLLRPEDLGPDTLDLTAET
jgi:hypothetical protein